MDHQDYFIPKNLDKPEQWLWFTVDEAVAMIALIFIGILVKNLIIGIILAILTMLTLRKIKSSENKNIINYFIYWYYPNFCNHNVKTLPSKIRMIGG